MGDVYRLVFLVHSLLQQFIDRMVVDNHGQLVIWRGRQPEVADRRVEWVAPLAWKDIVIEEAALRRLPVVRIFEELARSLGLPRGATDALRGGRPGGRGGAPVTPGPALGPLASPSPEA